MPTFLSHNCPMRLIRQRSLNATMSQCKPPSKNQNSCRYLLACYMASILQLLYTLNVPYVVSSFFIIRFHFLFYYYVITRWPLSWKPFQQCPLMRGIFAPGFIQIPPLRTETSRPVKQTHGQTDVQWTEEQQTYRQPKNTKLLPTSAGSGIKMVECA